MKPKLLINAYPGIETRLNWTNEAGTTTKEAHTLFDALLRIKGLMQGLEVEINIYGNYVTRNHCWYRIFVETIEQFDLPFTGFTQK